LQSLQLLLSEPNPDDPLDHDIADECDQQLHSMQNCNILSRFRKNQPLFAKKAKQHTATHAKDSQAQTMDAAADCVLDAPVVAPDSTTTPPPPPPSSLHVPLLSSAALEAGAAKRTVSQHTSDASSNGDKHRKRSAA
jgi:hypothetical protein